MAKKIPIEKMDAFCDRLFRALDRADLLPLRLNEAAHSFEKYSRILASLLGRYQRVEAAFDEWETRTLRGVSKYRREEVYPYFQELKAWMTSDENRGLFEGDSRKDNLNHFKRSLYGRIYTWLYPRRKVSMAYIQTHLGNVSQFEPEAIQRDFTSTIQPTLEELNGFDERVFSDAQAYLVINSGRFKKWKVKSDLDDEQTEEDSET